MVSVQMIYYIDEENDSIGWTNGTVLDNAGITETGLSISPNAPNVGPPDYGYGGNTEQEQSVGIIQNINDLESANFDGAGIIIHEFLDAWWKFSLEDSYTQDPDDIEEWFGIVKIVG